MSTHFFKILFIAQLVCMLCHAQDPVIRNINNLNGLPSNTVYFLLQDKKGFVWIAHDRGLSRYDGKTFKAYINNSQNSRSLSNLMEDSKGRIWCQDFTGNFFYTEGDSLKHCDALPSTGSFRSASILEGDVLVSITDDKLRGLNISTNQLVSIAFTETISQNHYVEKGNAFLLGTKHVFKFDGKNLTVISENNNPGSGFFITKTGNQLFQINRSVWPYILPIQNNEALRLALPRDLFIQNVVTNADKETWLVTSKGAYCFDENMQQLYNGHCFFEDKSISGVFKDAENNYWFSTIGNGILLVPEINVRLFANEGSISVLTPSNTAGGLLAGTAKNQVLQMDTKRQTFTKLFDANIAHEAISIYQAADNSIVYCGDKTYFLQNGTSKVQSSLSVKSSVAINEHFLAIAYTSGISLLPSSSYGIANLPGWLQSYVTKNNYRNETRLDLATATRGRYVTYNKADSTIYAATTKGLLYWSPYGAGSINNGTEQIYATQVKIVGTKAYVSTFNNGIFILNKNKIEKNISTKEGLISNTVYKFQKSGHKIWMISDELLQVYNETDGTTQKFDYTDGLPRAELKDIIVQDGMVYVATTEGLTVFSEMQNHLNETSPRIEIGHIRLKETGQKIDSTTKLSYKENAIVVDFSVLAFRADKKIKVAYSINGSPWQLLEEDARELNLPSLSPGNYTVQLRAFNEDGFASQKNVQCRFFIEAPFYKRLWFLIPLSFFSAFLIYLLMQRRINSIRKTNTLQEQKLQLEQDLQKSMLTSIKSQMNPHFIFNALNTIQSFIYSNNKQDANAYLAKFSHLMRMVLEMSNHETVLLEEEIRALKLYLEMEQVRFDDTLEFSFISEPDVRINHIRIPSMIIQPYVENAIKHGLLHRKINRQLLITFSMAEAGKVLRVTIDDNGVGRKNSAELNRRKTNRFASFSSAANQKRLELLNKDRKTPIGITYIDKTDHHGIASGTTVILNIPLNIS
jgi:two-component sensor histidine kinase